MNARLESLPMEVGQIGNFEARMLRNFRAALEDWDEVCSALGRWEAEYLTEGDSGISMEVHHKWLGELLAWGELVLQTTQHTRFPQPALAARVTQRMVHLRDKLALWHGEMSPQEEDRIVQSAFM